MSSFFNEPFSLQRRNLNGGTARLSGWGFRNETDPLTDVLLGSPAYLVGAGAALLFAAAVVRTGPGAAPGLAQAAIAFASFYILIGAGQMLVITSGPGNIDLSIPFVMVLGVPS